MEWKKFGVDVSFEPLQLFIVRELYHKEKETWKKKIG
jgi:hypothetical protein